MFLSIFSDFNPWLQVSRIKKVKLAVHTTPLFYRMRHVINDAWIISNCQIVWPNDEYTGKRFDDQVLNTCEIQFSFVPVKAIRRRRYRDRVFWRRGFLYVYQRAPHDANFSKQGNRVPSNFIEFLNMMRSCSLTPLSFFPTVTKMNKFLLTFPVFSKYRTVFQCSAQVVNWGPHFNAYGLKAADCPRRF